MKSLQRWLETSDITQSEFAEGQDVKQATVSDWVLGKTSPSPQKLLSISKATRIPVATLLRECAEHERARHQKKSA